MFKKWRPFWSYDIEKTERWLSEMAMDGKRLAGVKLLSRIFLFENKSPEEINYVIEYDKGKIAVSSSLIDAGWEVKQSTGNWKFLQTTDDDIKMYPSKAGILKRNRLHSNVLTGISLLYSYQLFFAFIILFFSWGESEIEPSPFWAITVIYFIQVIVVIGLSIYAKRKIRQFERKYFDSGVDGNQVTRETFTKWKFGWKLGPDLLEKWLSDMALKGNYLVKIEAFGTKFTFEKRAPKHIAYVYDYQVNTSSFYYNVHKEAGWRLLLTSPSVWTKFSLWMKEYEEGEEKPVIHEMIERKAQVRKIAVTNLGSSLAPIIFAFFVLLINWRMIMEDPSSFPTFLIAALSIPIIISFFNILRSIRYIFRMKNVLQKSNESIQ